MISGCAATHQTGRYASAGCGLAACAPAASPTNSRYGTPMAKNYCYAPPIMIVPQVRLVQVEKPVYVDCEKIVEVEKTAYVKKEVFIEVSAKPVTCCAYPEPTFPVHPHYLK